MNNESKDERYDKIIELLDLSDKVTVPQLAKLFSTSGTTIRNDLKYLSGTGKLTRIRGGAVRKNLFALDQEQPLIKKREKAIRLKKVIGKATAQLIQENDTIMLEAGTTIEQVACNLLNFDDLTIITNGITILNILSMNYNIQLYTVGGKISNKSFSIVGPKAESDFQTYYANVCIIGCDGIDLSLGLTNNSQEAASVALMMMERSQKTIVVCDSTKIGKAALIPFSPIENVNILVTDNFIPSDKLEFIENQGVEVIIAESDKNPLSAS
ncbi:MAG: DeoR/GlpR transcriptional regulator [bacterium]|nr:DeoR/GlpR transcriptional regulator [bacterium]